MTKNEHELIHAEDSGNGYHGRCKHCSAPLVTDLGYCSWDGLKCVDREIIHENEMPQELRSFANFKGMIFNRDIKKFVKPYGTEDDDLTIDQLNDMYINIKAFKICQN